MTLSTQWSLRTFQAGLTSIGVGLENYNVSSQISFKMPQLDFSRGRLLCEDIEIITFIHTKAL